MPALFAGENATSPWAGLWDVTQVTHADPVTLHLFVSNDQKKIHLFSPYWDPLYLAEASIEGDVIRFNWPAKGVSQMFTGSRSGNAIKGSWQLVHPQYQMSNQFSARRVHSQGSIAPLSEMVESEKSGLIDLSGLLMGQNELNVYWEKTFFPNFYPLLTPGLKGETVIQTLQNPNFRKRSVELKEQIDHFLINLRRKFPTMDFPLQIVSLPVGGTEPEIRKAAGTAYLLINPDRFKAQTALDVSREILAASFQEFWPITFPGKELLRQGLPLLLLTKIESNLSESDVLQMTDGEFQSYEGNVALLKKKLADEKPLTKAEQRFMSYHFVRSLAESKKVDTLVRLKPAQVTQAYRAYVQS